MKKYLIGLTTILLIAFGEAQAIEFVPRQDPNECQRIMVCPSEDAQDCADGTEEWVNAWNYPATLDSDGDEVPDRQEDKDHDCQYDNDLNETNPHAKDSDGDGIHDKWEVINQDTGGNRCPDAADPTDCDGDGRHNGHDDDSDNDGIKDKDENCSGDTAGLMEGLVRGGKKKEGAVSKLTGPTTRCAPKPGGSIYTWQETDPYIPDSDGDGMPNTWEYNYDFLPMDPADGALDTDGDGLGNACDDDDDNDGLTDASEAAKGTDPLDSDTDNDGVLDGKDLYPTDPSRSEAKPPAPSFQKQPASPPAERAPSSPPPPPPPPTTPPTTPSPAPPPAAEETPVVEESAYRITIPAIASVQYSRLAWNTYELEANSLEGVGEITVLWRFGDGTTSAERRVTHRYKKTGTYLVILEVTDTAGTIARDQVKIQVSFFNPENPLFWALVGGVAAAGLGAIIGVRLLERKRSRS